MKKFIRNISIIFTTILFGACTLSMDEYVVSEEEKGVHEAYTEKNEFGEVTYKYRDTVTPLNGAPQGYIVSLNDSVIWFSDNLPSKWVPKAGRYIAANCSEVIHLGLCAKVTNVTRENGMIKVSYVPATEYEVFEHLEMRIDFDYVMPNLNGPEDTLATRACGRRGYWKNDSVFVDFSLADRMLNGGTRAENDEWAPESSEYKFSASQDFEFGKNTVKIYGEVNIKSTEFVRVHAYRNTTEEYAEEWNDSYSEKEVQILAGIGGTREEVTKKLVDFPHEREDFKKFKDGVKKLGDKIFKEEKPSFKNISPIAYLPGFPLGFMFRYTVDAGVDLSFYGSISYKSRTPVRRVGTIIRGKKKEKIDKEVTISGIKPYSTWEDIYGGGSIDVWGQARVGIGVVIGEGVGAGIVLGAQLKAGFKASLETEFLDEYTILDRQQIKAGPYITFSGFAEGVVAFGPWTVSVGDIQFMPIEIIPGAMVNMMAEVNTEKTSAKLVAKENQHGVTEYAVQAKVDFKKLETFLIFPISSMSARRVAIRVYEGGVRSGTGEYVDIYGPDKELKANTTYEFDEVLANHGLEVKPNMAYEVIPCIYNKSDGTMTEYRNNSIILSPAVPVISQPKCYQWYGMDVEDYRWEYYLQEYGEQLAGYRKEQFTEYAFSTIFDTAGATSMKEMGLAITVFHPTGKKLIDKEVPIPRYGIYKSGKYSVICEFLVKYKQRIENYGTDALHVKVKPYFVDGNGERKYGETAKTLTLTAPFQDEDGPEVAGNEVNIDFM